MLVRVLQTQMATPTSYRIEDKSRVRLVMSDQKNLKALNLEAWCQVAHFKMPKVLLKLKCQSSYLARSWFSLTFII